MLPVSIRVVVGRGVLRVALALALAFGNSVDIRAASITGLKERVEAGRPACLVLRGRLREDTTSRWRRAERGRMQVVRVGSLLLSVRTRCERGPARR